ncbi:MAG: prephenate dehydratase [Promethearchaeota archaeon]
MSENREKEKDLKRYREQIDEIDHKIIELINERGKIVLKISEIKKDLHLKTYQPQREKEIIERIKSKSEILKSKNIEAIWKEIMGACKDIQGTIIKVGYLGPQGSFTHQAALEFFPKAGTDFIACKNVPEVFEQIEKDNLEFGVVPIENSLQGTVRETLDLLIEKNIIIYGELELKINQNLITLRDSNLEKIKTIYSHPQAFAQTRGWIKANLPLAKLVNTSSTSAAVKKIKELKDSSNAAIGTEIAGKFYDLKILASNIEDIPDNYTRFIVISKKENELKEGKVKTSIVYVTKHIPGALYRVLKLFAEADINLTKIESRPRRKGRWEYIFLMDFEGDKENSKVQETIEKMKENVIWYKILGSYPLS